MRPLVWTARSIAHGAIQFSIFHGAGTDIKRLLQSGSNFVVAEAGQPLRWISESDRFDFWKAEVKCRLVAADADGFHLDDYPGSYCYVASMWKGASSTPIIVLEKHH